MEDFAIDIVVGKKTTAKTIRLELPKFTLIGATTKVGMLTAPLLSRFGIVLNMDFYSIEDIKNILKRSAKLLLTEITPEATEEIAKCSRGIPRIANQLLKRIHDYAVYHDKKTINLEIAKEGLKFLGYNEYGLNDTDLKYLDVLINRFKMKPVGLNTLIATLSMDKYTIEEVIEPYLLRIGLIEKTSRGRKATELAKKIMEKK
jgi:Holliday junction DNA helicase RuvB